MVDETRVDVPELDALGRRLQATAEQASRNVAAAQGGLAPRNAPSPGPWATDVAIRAAAAGWQDYLRGYLARVQQAAASLIAAADSYRSSDERSQRGLTGPRYE